MLVALVTAACSSLNERDLRRGRAGYRALAGMAAEIQRVEGLEEIGPRLLKAVERYTGYPRAMVLLPGATDGALRCWSSGGRQAETAFGPSGPAGVVLRSWNQREPVLARRLDPSADGPLVEGLPEARNVVALPLFSGQRPLGALVVERGGGRWARVPASVVALLGQFAAHAMLAYQTVGLREELRRLAALDPLTGLPNRRMFDENVTREIQRVGRTKEPLAILMLDIDHFKEVNDRQGTSSATRSSGGSPTWSLARSAAVTCRPATAARSSRCCSPAATRRGPSRWRTR